MKGKLIVIYGINNLGKSTQSNLLANYLSSKGLKVDQIKFPDYSLEPSGTKLYDIFRSKKQEISEKELQLLCIENIKQLQSKIKKLLERGVYLIFEDYRGTTLAWGSSKGLPIEWLEEKTDFAVKEDLVILLDGKRFLESKGPGHIHEHDDKLMERVRNKFLDLAKENDWKIINANQDRDTIHKQIREELKEII